MRKEADVFIYTCMEYNELHNEQKGQMNSIMNRRVKKSWNTISRESTNILKVRI